MIYDFITPSDPITFKADSKKVAYFCALILGNGKAGCNSENGESLGTMLMFDPNAKETAEEFLEESLDSFPKHYKEDVISCFQSFSYGSTSNRKTYDSAIEAITDPQELKEFKRKHEDENRTSMSQWVKSAWDYADSFKKAQEAK